MTAPDAQEIAHPNVHAVCCLAPSLYHPVTYMCIKFPGRFTHIYCISWD